jgi:hypothetical protein
LYNLITKSPRKGRIIPVQKNPRNPNIQFSAELTPTLSGNTRFPDPKNIENIENPYKKICRFVIILIP